MLDLKIPSSFDQFIREHIDLHAKVDRLKYDNTKLMSHNRQLMDQLSKQIEANDKLLKRLRELEERKIQDNSKYV